MRREPNLCGAPECRASRGDGPLEATEFLELMFNCPMTMRSQQFPKDWKVTVQSPHLDNVVWDKSLH